MGGRKAADDDDDDDDAEVGAPDASQNWKVPYIRY